MPSENGWEPARLGRDRLDTSNVPGTNVQVPLMSGDVSRLMKAFAADYHTFIEPLYQHDIGGWTPTNAVATSNHLNGTAMDLRWQSHPFKVRGTFTPQQLSKIRELQRFYTIDGLLLIFWGGDWKSPIDEMHWQMGYNTYQNRHLVARFVREKIRPDGFSTYRFGGGESPSAPRKLVEPAEGGTFWCDVSQWQEVPVDNTYQHKVFSFRTNSGNAVDTLAHENARNTKELLDSGQLELAIPYYFFRPGQANCDLHREILEDTGLFNHPRTVTMVDVEGDNGSVVGNHNWEINDEVKRLQGWYNNPKRVVGYYNSNADPNLWTSRNGLNLVVPQYYRTPGDISSIKDPSVRYDAFAHQFTDRATDQPPWRGRNVDMNWSPYSVPELLVLLGIQEQGGLFMHLTREEELAIRDKILGYPNDPNIAGKWPSRAIFRDTNNGVDDTFGMMLNTDGNVWDILVIIGALAGVTEHRNRIERLARGEGPNGKNERLVQLARELLRFIQGGSAEEKNAQK